MITYRMVYDGIGWNKWNAINTIQYNKMEWDGLMKYGQ